MSRVYLIEQSWLDGRTRRERGWFQVEDGTDSAKDAKSTARNWRENSDRSKYRTRVVCIDTDAMSVTVVR